MDNEPLVQNWRATIISDCKRILGRGLTDDETSFITSRGAFIALEAIHDHVRSLVGNPQELQRYLRSEASGGLSETPVGVGVELDYTRYRSAWIAIFRRQFIAKALRYAVLIAVFFSLIGLVPRLPAQLLLLPLALTSLVAHIAIRCPRCHAWWPWGSDDDGKRKPCAQCRLHWGQEDELPDT